jgi:hypothetical protein
MLEWVHVRAWRDMLLGDGIAAPVGLEPPHAVEADKLGAFNLVAELVVLGAQEILAARRQGGGGEVL